MPLNILYLFLQEGTDVEELIKTKDKKIYRQPYLLAIGQVIKPSQYFIILDTSIPLDAGTSTVEAVDRLFKAHYALNVHYAAPLQDFWDFLDHMVYGVKRPASARPNVRAIASSVRATSL